MSIECGAVRAALTPQERAYRRFAARVALCVVSGTAGVLAALWWLL